MTDQEQKAPVVEEEAPLTPGKKRALIEYLGILFAAAFLFVAVSLFFKMDAMQDDFNVANQGARENIKLMEARLSAAEAENTTLTTDLEAVRAENDTLSAELETAKTDFELLTADLDAANSEKDKLASELAASEREAAATALLLLAYQALESGDDETFANKMTALAAYTDALSPEMQTIYNELLTKLD